MSISVVGNSNDPNTKTDTVLQINKVHYMSISLTQKNKQQMQTSKITNPLLKA